MAPAAMLTASTPRQVPRIAPRILFSSKESIASRFRRKAIVDGTAAGRPPRFAAAHKYPVCLASGNPYKPAVPRGILQRPTLLDRPPVLTVTPAGLASTRLPGKPLADIAGEPMIVHVMRRALAARLGPVVVATDSEAVAACVEKAGGRAVMTRADHVSGSDRIFEALEVGDPQADIVVNVQGDLPTPAPSDIAAPLGPL